MNKLLRKQLQQAIDGKTKPLGALGQLEEIALQIGMIQQTLTPKIEKPALLVFAADHGLAEEKISPNTKDVTWQMVMNFVHGGAAINVFCRLNGIDLKVIDAGVDHDFPEGLPIVNAKMGYGTRNMLHAPAMSTEECDKALKKGAEQVIEVSRKGCNTLGFGEMGIGNTSSASLLMHRFLNLPIEECVGAGAGSAGAALEYKQRILTEVARKYNPSGPLETLVAFGGFEIAMMTGAFLEAKRQNMIILVDGFIASAAMLAASRFDSGLIQNCIFCHQSHEKAHSLLLKQLNVKPVLDLGMRLGEGTGAAVALPVIKAACAFLNEMASFDEAGVSEKN